MLFFNIFSVVSDFFPFKFKFIVILFTIPPRPGTACQTFNPVSNDTKIYDLGKNCCGRCTAKGVKPLGGGICFLNANIRVNRTDDSFRRKIHRNHHKPPGILHNKILDIINYRKGKERKGKERKGKEREGKERKGRSERIGKKLGMFKLSEFIDVEF